MTLLSWAELAAGTVLAGQQGAAMPKGQSTGLWVHMDVRNACSHYLWPNIWEKKSVCSSPVTASLPWCSETAAGEELFLECQGQLLPPASFWACYTKKTTNNQRRQHETLGERKTFPGRNFSLIFKAKKNKSSLGFCTKQEWWFGFCS